MKDGIFLALLISVALVGCSSLTTSKTIAVKREVTSDLELALIPFHPPYLDHRLLVHVSSPAEMKNEVISLSIMNGWGSEAVKYGDEKLWEHRTGTIEFDVHPRDIQVVKDGHRRINVDRIKVRKWPNRVAGSDYLPARMALS